MHTFDDFDVISTYSVDDAISDGGLVDISACPADEVIRIDEPAPEPAPEPTPEPEAEADPSLPLSFIDSMDDYLRSYGKILGRKAVTSLKPLHVPNRDPMPDMDDLLREPFDAQAHVIAANVRLLQDNGSGFTCGTMGTGKTLLAMASVYKHAQLLRSQGGNGGKFRCLVLCPDHLIAKWKREIEETIPGAKTYHFGTLSREDAKARKKEDGKTGQRPAINDLINLLDKRDGDRWSKPDGPEFYVIGRDQVKWLPDWLGTTDQYKGFNCVGGLLGGKRVVKRIGKHPDGTPITMASQVQGIASGEPRETPLTSRNIVVDHTNMTDANGNPVLDANGRVKRRAVTARAFTCPKCGNVIRDKKGVPVSAQAIAKNQMTCEGRYLQQVPTADRTKHEHGLDKITPMPDKFRERTGGHVNIGTNKYEVKTCGEPLWWYTSKKYRYPLARIIQRKFRRFFKYLIVDECHEQKSDTAAQSMAAGKLIGAADHVLALTGTLIGGYADDIFPLLLRICPKLLRAEGFEWGKGLEFSKVYGRIDRIVSTKEEAGVGVGAGKGQASMRRAKTGKSTERVAVRPGIMPTLFGRHMMGNTVFIELDEMAEGLPDLFEYIGGECPPPPEEPADDASEEDREAYEVELDRYERMKAFWVDTACHMEPAQRQEYHRIETTLDFAAKELLKRGSMKLLGTMLATTLGWPDFCHAEWAMDDDLVKAINGAGDDPDTPQAPALLGQSFLKRFDYSFDSDTETLVLTEKGTGDTDRIPLKKDGGVYWLDVTFNGGKTKRLVYDTGASTISLPLAMAIDLGMAPGPEDANVNVQVADGRIVKAKRKMAGSVKVGKFTANDVECSIDMPGGNVHTVGYWDKPGNKDIKNWMGVVTPKPTGADKVYPKEQALVDICKLHKKAGHQTWVYCQMTGKRNVMPRLKEILEREGLKVGIMKPDNVPPKEREEWIAANGRDYDVMICFPKLVSTGLDLFSKVQGGHNYNCIVFYETGYKLNEMRQAARRAWRIGQPRDCYIYYLYYQETMQHRAMSLMSRKMAAALALEGEFSEEGLAALSGDGDEQMALAKSMSEKIDDADMQRSWQKVKSSEKKPKKKKPTEGLAAMATDAEPGPLDDLQAEAELLARTVLERQKQAVPLAAKDDIIALAEHFAELDAGMWAAARRMADGQPEPEPVVEEVVVYVPDPVVEAEPEPEPEEVEPELDGEQDEADSGLGYDESWPLVEPADIPAPKPEPEVAPEPKAEKPKLKIHQPKSPKKVHAVFDDIEFDDALIAKMMANMASHGMTAADIFG